MNAACTTAWYEWFPDFAHDFTVIKFNPGDSVSVTVTASDKTGGEATITNHATRETVSHTFTGQPALCEENAEWIVEDYEESGSLVPFPDFGTVTFTDAYATSTDGSSISPDGATIVDIEQNDQALTSSSASGSSVTIQYV